MFAPGCGPEYAAIVRDAMVRRMREARRDDPARCFDIALALILPALRAHLAAQSDTCRIL